MSSVYAYLQRSICNPKCDSQRRDLAAYCRQKRLPDPQVFVDGRKTNRTPWLKRPAGRKLAAQLKLGDRVIVPDSTTILTRMDDLLPIAQDCHAKGIEVNFIDGPELTLGGPHGEKCIAALQEVLRLRRMFRSEAAREAAATRRRRGGKWPGAVPVGYHRERREDGTTFLVIDPKQMDQMRRIAELRAAGNSYENIWRQFLYGKVRRADGREWTPAAVRRAYERWERLAPRSQQLDDHCDESMPEQLARSDD
jgi:DNA invertase Pin-like site-specific DNA recombinase